MTTRQMAVKHVKALLRFIVFLFEKDKVQETFKNRCLIELI